MIQDERLNIGVGVGIIMMMNLSKNKNMGNIEFYRDDDSQYYLPPLESYNGFTKQKHVIEPEAGMLLLFPGWVKHAVQGNRTNRDRVSISFNYGVR